jgi:hypothetical protein
MPKVFAACGGKQHDDGKKLTPESIVWVVSYYDS